MVKDKDRDLIENINSALIEDTHNIFQKVLSVQLKPILERLNAIERRLEAVEKEQKNQAKTIKYVKETLDVAFRSFNGEDMELRKRVKRIETHLELPRFE